MSGQNAASDPAKAPLELSGAKSEPRANPFDRSFGGIVSNVEGWVWLVVFGLFLAASIIAIVT